MGRIYGMDGDKGAKGRGQRGVTRTRSCALTRSCAGVALLALGVGCSRTGRSVPTAARAPETRAAAVEPVVSAASSTVTGVGTPPILPTANTPRADSVTRRSSADSTPPEITTAAILKLVATVFGDSAPPPATVAAVVPGAPLWDMDVHSYEAHTRVAHFVDVFSGRAREPFEKSLQRQTRYGALIRQKLREGGLPEDMIYLALIESWYDPHAYSKAAAVGMWQFMAGTARGVGLRVDWWVDERRDPVRSTEGAVRLLRSLRSKFGSLYLAAAAYDGGDGRVSRGLARLPTNFDGVEGDDRFFALADTKYLRAETRDYVPKLIAAALVGKEPARYGVSVDSAPAWAADSVRVGAATPLWAIAMASTADVAGIRELNPHVLRGMTPPGESLWVRVPAGAAEDFAVRYLALDPAARVAVMRVETRKGESMTSIARKHGLTARQLGWYNPKVVRLKSGNLSVGQTILLPTRATAAAAMDVPNPSIERYPRRRSAARTAGVKTASVAKKAPYAPGRPR